MTKVCGCFTGTKVDGSSAIPAGCRALAEEHCAEIERLREALEDCLENMHVHYDPQTYNSWKRGRAVLEKKP